MTRIDASAAAAWSSTSEASSTTPTFAGGDAGDHLHLDLVAALVGGRAARGQDRDDRPLELYRIEAPVRRTIGAPAAHENPTDAVGERCGRLPELEVRARGEGAAET